MSLKSLAAALITTSLLSVNTEFADFSDDVTPNSNCDVNNLLQERVLHVHGNPHDPAIKPADKEHLEFQVLTSNEPMQRRSPFPGPASALASSSILVPSLRALGLLTLMNMLCLAVLVLLGKTCTQDQKDEDPRDTSLDHAKWILVGMVCFTHIVQKSFMNPLSWQEIDSHGLWNHPVIQIWVFIYVFMMPTFCFLSGRFSQNYVKLRKESSKQQTEVIVTHQRLHSTLVHLLLASVFFQVLKGFVVPAIEYAFSRFPQISWQGLMHHVKPISDNFLMVWYLVALVLWRLVLPFWSCLHFPMRSARLVWRCFPLHSPPSLSV